MFRRREDVGDDAQVILAVDVLGAGQGEVGLHDGGVRPGVAIGPGMKWE